MTKRALLETLTGHQQTFIENITKLGEDFGQGALRKMRVSLKTLKSFSQFIHFSEESTLKGIKLDKSIKILYKKGGAIRSRHVSRKKAKQLLEGNDENIIDTFEKYCKENVEKMVPSFKDTTQSYLSQGEHIILFDTIIQYFTKTTLVSLKQNYILYKQAIIEKIVSLLDTKKISDEGLHEIRKEVKHLLYFAHLFGDRSVNDFVQFSKQLGRWNDQIELTNTLALFGKSNKSVKKWAKKTRKEIKNIIKEQKMTIISDLKNHFTKE